MRAQSFGGATRQNEISSHPGGKISSIYWREFFLFFGNFHKSEAAKQAAAAAAAMTMWSAIVLQQHGRKYIEAGRRRFTLLWSTVHNVIVCVCVCVCLDVCIST